MQDASKLNEQIELLNRIEELREQQGKKLKELRRAILLYSVLPKRLRKGKATFRVEVMPLRFQDRNKGRERARLIAHHENGEIVEVRATDLPDAIWNEIVKGMLP